MMIELTLAEVIQAALAGVMRRVQNMKRGTRDRFGQPTTDYWSIDIEGCCGELAVAKYLGRFWSGAIGDISADDVGVVQVRTTGRESGRLILHPEDKDDRVFILVVGNAPRFDIRGWIIAQHGKRDEFWSDPGTGRPAFFVPQSALKPIEELDAPIAEAAE